MDNEEIERIARRIEDMAEEAIAAVDERAYAFGMLGGDVGVTDEERARWNAAPSPADIAQEVRKLLGASVQPAR